MYPIPKFPQVLGLEASGVVVSLPSDDKVLNDEWYKKRNFKIGSRVAVYGVGAFVEYTSSPWHMVFPLPDSISYEIAAAALLQGMLSDRKGGPRPPY